MQVCSLDSDSIRLWQAAVHRFLSSEHDTEHWAFTQGDNSMSRQDTVMITAVSVIEIDFI